MPKVSVILPTYNREKLLGRAIQSVLDQTYDDFELIVVDDGSTDKTEMVVKSFKSEKITYVKLSENKGAASARNHGIALAKGYYIAFQDSDDEWMVNKLEKQIKVFNESPSSVGIVYCSSTFLVNGHRNYFRCFEYRMKDSNILSNIVQRGFVSTQTLIVKRECFEKAGNFDERFPCLEDWELFLRLSKLYSFIGIDEPLVIRYFQSDSLSGNTTTFRQAFIILLQIYYDDIKHDNKLLSKCYLKLGHCTLVDGNIKEGRNYIWLSIKANPFDPRVVFSFVLSLFGSSIYGTFTRIHQWIRLHIFGYPF